MKFKQYLIKKQVWLHGDKLHGEDEQQFIVLSFQIFFLFIIATNSNQICQKVAQSTFFKIIMHGFFEASNHTVAIIGIHVKLTLQTACFQSHCGIIISQKCWLFTFIDRLSHEAALLAFFYRCRKQVTEQSSHQHKGTWMVGEGVKIHEFWWIFLQQYMPCFYLLCVDYTN